MSQILDDLTPVIGVSGYGAILQDLTCSTWMTPGRGWSGSAAEKTRSGAPSPDLTKWTRRRKFSLRRIRRLRRMGSPDVGDRPDAAPPCGLHPRGKSENLSDDANRLWKSARAKFQNTIWNMPVRHAGGGDFDVFQYDRFDKSVCMEAGLWRGLDCALGERFAREAQTLFGRDPFIPGNWESRLFSRFVEAFEITASEQRKKRRTSG